jgi:hypothetical protein
MQSILNVVTPATVTSLTTLARVKSELNISDRTSDALLSSKIAEASSDIQATLGYTLPAEDVAETFWHQHRHQLGYAYGSGYGYGNLGGETTEILFLRRTPVVSIASVTLDGDLVDPTEYRLDDKAGLLWRLDASGFPCTWIFCQSIVIAYRGGFVLPGQAGRTLEPAIEAATVSLVSSFWHSRGRDPTVKSVDIPGVRRTEYWVGSIGEAGELPPDVLMKLAPFRRVRMAVA